MLNKELAEHGITEQESLVLNQINNIWLHGRKTGKLYACSGREIKKESTATERHYSSVYALYICVKSIAKKQAISVSTAGNILRSLCKKGIFHMVKGPHKGFNYYIRTDLYFDLFKDYMEKFKSITPGKGYIFGSPPRHRSLAENEQEKTVLYGDFNFAECLKENLKPRDILMLKQLMKKFDNEKMVHNGIIVDNELFLMVTMTNLMDTFYKKHTKKEIQSIKHLLYKLGKIGMTDKLNLRYFFKEKVTRIVRGKYDPKKKSQYPIYTLPLTKLNMDTLLSKSNVIFLRVTGKAEKLLLESSTLGKNRVRVGKFLVQVGNLSVSRVFTPLTRESSPKESSPRQAPGTTGTRECHKHTLIPTNRPNSKSNCVAIASSVMRLSSCFLPGLSLDPGGLKINISENTIMA